MGKDDRFIYSDTLMSIGPMIGVDRMRPYPQSSDPFDPRMIEEMLYRGGPRATQEIAQMMRAEVERVKGQLAQAQQAVAMTNEAMNKLRKQPSLYGSVLKNTKSGCVSIIVAGKRAEVSKPLVELVPGDTVRVTGDTMQILDKVEDNDPTGEIVTLKSVNGTIGEVERAGSARAVVVPTTAEAGDRIVLDDSGTIALAVLGPEPGACLFGESTGITWDDIGGLEQAKAHLREAIEGPFKQKDTFARFKKRPTKGVLLYGPPGCVDGDAMVSVNRAGKGFKIRLRDLVDRFNGGAPSSGRKWDLSIPTMARCLHNGEFRLRRIVGAYPKGVKPVFKMTLADGKVLRLTGDHEVCTEGGIWRRTDSITRGSVVLTNGLAAETVVDPSRYLHKGYWIVCDGLSRHPRARKTSRGGYEMPEHQLAMEAKLNGVSYREWLEIVRRGDLTGREHIPVGMEVHHKDEDPTNNAPGNLEMLTKSEHAQRHSFRLHLPVFLAKSVEVVSCVPDGEADVFDITVEEAHNFVANGIVVHNCGKTILGKAAATAIASLHGADAKGGFYYVKGPELLNMYVGNTEANIRKMFDGARKHEKKHGFPAVIFIDEADAILGARGGRAGYGLERTIVPQFLAEMDGLGDTGAIVLLATNRPGTLDPAIVRDGRIDRRVHVTRPSRRDSRSIAALALRGKPIDDDADLASLVVDAVFNDGLVVSKIMYEESGQQLREDLLLAHTVSGAMLTGVVERATSCAIARGADRIEREDAEAAVVQTFNESLDMNHNDELLELCSGFLPDVTNVRKGSRIHALPSKRSLIETAAE